jgi:D-glycero-beta-D-manno-heptose-7-phosphate kinase
LKESALFFDHLFTEFTRKKVLIVGDVMIDSYVWGKVNRISPEAPIPVLSAQENENRLGGAANVALNIQSLGAEPVLCATIGSDPPADQFLQIMQKRGMATDGILQSCDRITTVKERFIAGSQQLLRVDSEIDHLLNTQDTGRLLESIVHHLSEADVVLFQDYDKGVLHPELIDKVIREARLLNIPVVVDPKKRNFLQYRGATLFKPNLKELKEGLKLDELLPEIASVNAALEKLQEMIQADLCFVTLSENGAFIRSNDGKHTHIKAHHRSIADVSGAGDTVVSIAALCLACGLKPNQIATLSNLGGGLVCEHVGVVPVNREKLLEEAKRLLAGINR